MNGNVLEGCVELKVDVGIFPRPCEQGRLQIGAMDDPVRCAVAHQHRVAEREARNLPTAARRHYADVVRRDDAFEEVLLKPETDQDAACVRRQLDACAGLVQTRRALKTVT